MKRGGGGGGKSEGGGGGEGVGMRGNVLVMRGRCEERGRRRNMIDEG